MAAPARRRLRAGLGRWWQPPQPWTHRPASLAALTRYAARGGWAGPDSPARRVMVWWVRLVAIPVSTLALYLAWLAARPARAVVAVAVWAAVMQLAPARAVAGWLLPWDPWPAPAGPVWLVTAAAAVLVTVWAASRRREGGEGDAEDRR